MFRLYVYLTANWSVLAEHVCKEFSKRNRRLRKVLSNKTNLPEKKNNRVWLQDHKKFSSLKRGSPRGNNNWHWTCRLLNRSVFLGKKYNKGSCKRRSGDGTNSEYRRLKYSLVTSFCIDISYWVATLIFLFHLFVKNPKRQMYDTVCTRKSLFEKNNFKISTVGG